MSSDERKQTNDTGVTQLYTPQDLMRIMQVGRSTIQELFNSGEIPVIKFNQTVRVDKRAFEKWLETKTTYRQ